MQKWILLQAGKYISKDKRFAINQIHDKGTHPKWLLEDKRTSTTYEHQSLRDCKLKVEKILKSAKA